MSESAEEWKRRVGIAFRDLRLFASLCLAQFIVWRIVRRLRKERAARLRHIKLVQLQVSKH